MIESFDDRQKSQAGKFATFAFLIISLYLFISNGGFSSLLSLKSLLFFIIGMFASALIVGAFVYYLQKLVSKLLIIFYKGSFSQKVIITTKVIGLILMIVNIVVTFYLTQFAYNTLIKTPEGAYVEISLKNDSNIKGYVIFNPNVKSLEECKATFANVLPEVMKKLPPPIPKNSIATRWKCSLTDPAKENNTRY